MNDYEMIVIFLVSVPLTYVWLIAKGPHDGEG